MRRALVIGLLLLAATACSEPPQKEIDQAQTALDLARTAGADTYAAEEYTAAAAGLRKAHDAVDQRDYRQALSYAIDARQRAQNAIAESAQGKSRAQEAAAVLVTDVARRAAQLQERLQAAEEAKVPEKDLRAPRAMAADVQSGLQEARTAIAAGNYARVTKSLIEVRGKLDAAVRRLENIPPRPAHRKR